MQVFEHSDTTPVQVPRKVWTRDEAHALVELGVPGAAKLELIEGELIDRTGKKRPHVIWQMLMQEWLRSTFGAERVEVEAPNDVAEADNVYSEPEPDLKVLRRSLREYSTNPTAEDVLLLVEISDSTLRFDLRVKAALYARANIPEYWVVNVGDKQLIVHRDPSEGRYTSVVQYEANESVAPLAAPECQIRLDRL